MAHVNLHFVCLDRERHRGDLLALDRENLPGSVSASPRGEYPVATIELEAESDRVESPVERIGDEICERYAKWFAARDATLAERLGELLDEGQSRVSVAESCTGGGLGADFTEESGASSWFEGGFITYSNALKRRLLGVDSEVLEQYGAVSRPVVAQMARGAREASNTDYALSISGIAGPTGGTPEKPVGTVHFGLAAPSEIWHWRGEFTEQNRSGVRQHSIAVATALLIWRLTGRLERKEVDRLSPAKL